MARPPAAGERYERRELLRPGAVETWAGLDRTLNRPVTIRRAAADSEVGHRLRLQAKALARTEHHGLLHILDTYDEADHFAIVTEQLPTRLLANEIAAPDGTPKRLAVSEAVRIIIAVTEALAVLHSAGFAHGGLDAEFIGWRAEVGWIVLNGPPTDDAVAIPATRQADMASIAVLAHRLMTGDAPQRHSDGAWEFDPVVPDMVAAVLDRALGSPEPHAADSDLVADSPHLDRSHPAAWQRWPDLGSMLLELRAVVDQLDAAAPVEAERPSIWQAERHWIAPVGVLVTAAAMLVGVALIVEQRTEPVPSNAPPSVSETSDPVSEPGTQPGAAPSGTTGLGAPTTVTSAPRPTAVAQARHQPIPLESITDFDPAGDDRVEHPERLAFINDGDSSTGWSTARYNTRDFGGLKDGVGLIVVLAADGQSAERAPDASLPGEDPAGNSADGNDAQGTGEHGVYTVRRLAIDSPTVGWSFEVYASNERNRTLIDWGRPVAGAADVTGSAALNLPPTPAAALLVWITDLGHELESGGHRVTISRIEAAGPVGSTGADPATP